MPRTVKKDANLQPGKPLKPANLSPLASSEWDRLTGELEQAGIQVTAAHRTLLSLAATTAADIKHAWAAIEKDGAYIVTRTGLQAHPATKRIDALRRDYIKVLAILGLRAAVAGESKAGKQTLDDILNG
jgi:phage terminase small subunit